MLGIIFRTTKQSKKAAGITGKKKTQKSKIGRKIEKVQILFHWVTLLREHEKKDEPITAS
jgi:hypothetical protein